MRAALPKALFLAFTGTPLIAGEERTKDVFGDYVSIYDFQQSVEDGATVPLFYENRTPELQLVNPDLNEDVYSLIEAAELDPEQEAKLERELSGDERAEVKKVARDLLNRLKELLVLNWRQKSAARSQLKMPIEDVLDTGLPRAYDKPLYERKCSALFEHILDSYPERDASVYAAAD